MNAITVSAPGKLHLLGEHSVVYGKPAIIAAVNRRCIASLLPHKSATIVLSANTQLLGTISYEEVQRKTRQANLQWKRFSETNNPKILNDIIQNPCDFMSLCIGETLSFYHRTLPSGFVLSISSTIPLGSGMGSSSAVAVSIAGAVSLFLKESLDKVCINSIAYAIEEKKHGFPSGGDNTASCYGGCIWYQKMAPNKKNISQLTIRFSEKIAKKFIIIQTGIPEESTGEMVSMVKTAYQQNPSRIEAIFNHQAELVKQLPKAIHENNEEAFMHIIKEGEKNLTQLGVVSESTRKLIQRIEAIQGVAKICGAGGYKHASGIVLAFHSQLEVLTTMLKQNNIAYSPIHLGEEGLRQE